MATRTAFSIPFSASLTDRLGMIFTGFRRLATGVRRIIEHRAALNRLARLDSRMLADIGLEKGDVDAAMLAPLLHDPTAILTERSGARRRARRGLCG